jgi:hypothetical protein
MWGKLNVSALNKMIDPLNKLILAYLGDQSETKFQKFFLIMF